VRRRTVKDQSARMCIAYDPSRKALLQPGLRPTVFKAGDAERLSIDAICAECSRLVYLRFESSAAHRALLLEALARLDAVDWEGFDDPATGTQGYAAVLPVSGHALVVFRGTEPDRVSDLGADLNASMVEGPTGGAVHVGFANAFSGVGSKIGKWLDNHQGMQVIVTGHSLGGALATLSASQWAASRLVTFGSPRVGNVAFVGTVKAEAVARYVDCCDIVTRVPPETRWYTHVGATMYIDSAGQLRTSMTQEKIEADRTRARIDYLRDEAWRTGTVLVRDLADHAPINYERALFPPCEAG
jgi:hypothetical protein